MSVAEIAYERKTTYERWAPGQPVGVAGVLKLLDLDMPAREIAVQGFDQLNTTVSVPAV
jgi:hypothetical protein